MRRSKQEIAREAIHSSLTDEVGRLEDLQDELVSPTAAADLLDDRDGIVDEIRDATLTIEVVRQWRSG